MRGSLGSLLWSLLMFLIQLIHIRGEIPRLGHLLIRFMNISPAVSDPNASFLALCCLGWLRSQRTQQGVGTEGRAARGTTGASTAGALSQNTPKPLRTFKLCCSSACPSARQAGSRGLLRHIRPPVSIAPLFYLYLFKTSSLLSVLPFPPAAVLVCLVPFS